MGVIRISKRKAPEVSLLYYSWKSNVFPLFKQCFSLQFQHQLPPAGFATLMPESLLYNTKDHGFTNEHIVQGSGG